MSSWISKLRQIYQCLPVMGIPEEWGLSFLITLIAIYRREPRILILQVEENYEEQAKTILSFLLRSLFEGSSCISHRCTSETSVNEMQELLESIMDTTRMTSNEFDDREPQESSSSSYPIQSNTSLPHNTGINDKTKMESEDIQLTSNNVSKSSPSRLSTSSFMSALSRQNGETVESPFASASQSRRPTTTLTPSMPYIRCLLLQNLDQTPHSTQLFLAEVSLVDSSNFWVSLSFFPIISLIIIASWYFVKRQKKMIVYMSHPY